MRKGNKSNDRIANDACQKRGVAASTWFINGGFVVATFTRPKRMAP